VASRLADVEEVKNEYVDEVKNEYVEGLEIRWEEDGDCGDHLGLSR